MKKKIGIAIGIVLGAFIIFMGYEFATTKKHSPLSSASYSNNDLKLDVVYCKPYKKGRVIFGEKSSNALQPYGEYWRVGANEATTFETNKDVLINGQELKAGKYQLYAVPGQDQWTICFNSEWDRWGARDADHDKDVLKTEVAADNHAAIEEQLVIGFDEADVPGTTNMNIHWDQTLVKIPVAVK